MLNVFVCSNAAFRFVSASIAKKTSTKKFAESERQRVPDCIPLSNRSDFFMC